VEVAWAAVADSACIAPPPRQVYIVSPLLPAGRRAEKGKAGKPLRFFLRRQIEAEIIIAPYIFVGKVPGWVYCEVCNFAWVFLVVTGQRSFV
jgi:hypothetical protein